MLELRECCLQESWEEKWLVLAEKSQGDSKRSGVLSGHWLDVNQCRLLDARKAVFLQGQHMKGNEDKRSSLGSGR